MSITTRLSLPKNVETTAKSGVAQLLWIALFTILTAVAARVEIPHEPIPFTLQTLVVLLAGAFLGPRNGAISQLAYVALGILGAPVFAGGAFGFGVLLGPTGGYLIGFPVAAAITGALVGGRKHLLWVFFSLASGLVAIFTCGTAYLYAWFIHDFPTAFSTGFLIFSLWDLIKLFAATMIYHELAKRWPRLP